MFKSESRIMAALAATALAASAASPVSSENLFEAEIRPLLIDNCYSCHTQSKLGGLRVDSRAALLEGGKKGPAIVPGDANASLLVKAVRHEIDELKMPMGGKLPDGKIAALVKWIDDGAEWPEDPAVEAAADDGFRILPNQRKFWAFQDFAEVEVPAIKDKRIRNYIDAFVFAKLAEEGLEPSDPADKRTLIRRLSLDVAGLPPTPEQVDQFVNDKSLDAYEKLVDRLLDSKSYGERWGRRWLDVARYGEDDLHGIAKSRLGYEAYPKAHVYRDWVVKAFNDDLPYDTFVKAQLAADLMGKTEWEDKPRGEFDDDAMWGRLQVTKWNGLEKKERRALIPSGHLVDESLDQDLLPGLGFLGTGPWYYDLGDAWVMRADERNDRVDVVTRGLLGLTVACARCHDHKYDPISQRDYYSLAGVFFNSPYHEYPLENQTLVDHWRAKNELVKAQKKRIKDFLEVEAKQLALRLAYQAKDYMVAAWKVADDPKHDVAKAAYAGKLDVEVLERWIKFLAKPADQYPYFTEWQQLIEKGGRLDEAECLAEAFQETLLEATADYDENKKRNEKISAKAWPLDDKPPIPAPNQYDTPFAKYYIELEPMEPHPYKLYTDVFVYDIHAKKNADEMSSKTPGLLKFKDWGLESRLTAPAQQHLERLRADLKKLEKRRGEQYPFVMGVRDSDIITELPLHKRGNPLDLGDPVPRRFLEVLSPQTGPELFTKGSGRLELAEAIAGHPLTARVLVNRVWKWRFGSGLVDTPSNFGQVGERPTHPGLLDYMAQRFVDGGMSIKQLQRDMLLSFTYRQSSKTSPDRDSKDPRNRLYSRFSRLRLDSEQIRDSLLLVSGVLDDEVGGPSGDIDDPEFFRRSIYGKVSRFRLADYHQTFDFPNPNISAAQRFSTNVPLQRLFFMNSKLVRDLSLKLAARTVDPDPVTEDKPEAEKPAELPPNDERIATAYQLLFGRAPSAEEVEAGLEFLGEPDADDWGRYARALLSSNEFLYVN